jgi:hypothetical protein
LRKSSADAIEQQGNAGSLQIAQGRARPRLALEFNPAQN